MNVELAQRLHEEIVKLNPSPVVELYELDTTPCGPDGDVLYFHNGTNGLTVPVSFKGVAYTPLPIQVKGFELSGTGEPPRPTLSMMNAGGFLSAAVLKMRDLIGATLTRRRTFAKYLDGTPDAAPVEYPPDIFKIVQKLREDRLLVEFELGSGFDLDGVRFPRRTVVASYCQHVYRGMGCRFGGEYVVAGRNQTPFAGVLRLRGAWEASGLYTNGDAVTFFDGTYLGLYICTAGANVSVTGHASNPLNTGLWQRTQRFRGLHNTEDTYAINDVVFTEPRTGRQFFIAVRAVPVNAPPPNRIYWQHDECGKSLNHCRWRFDPQQTNRTPLPFGAFPGVTSIPEV